MSDFFFRRGTNKESSTICTKVLTSDHAVVNSQNSKYYVENQYFHRPNNIPDRRRLPCEVLILIFIFESSLIQSNFSGSKTYANMFETWVVRANQC